MANLVLMHEANAPGIPNGVTTYLSLMVNEGISAKGSVIKHKFPEDGKKMEPAIA